MSTGSKTENKSREMKHRPSCSLALLHVSVRAVSAELDSPPTS